MPDFFFFWQRRRRRLSGMVSPRWCNARAIADRWRKETRQKFYGWEVASDQETKKRSTSQHRQQSETDKNQFGRTVAPVRDWSGSGGAFRGLLSCRAVPERHQSAHGSPNGLEGGDISVREAAFPGG